MIVYTPYTESHAPGVVALEGQRVIALAHILSDGVVQAHLSLVGVLPSHRRAGIARALIVEAFRHTGGKWLDLVSEAGAEPFYRSFEHSERPGFRLYPAEGRQES